MNSFLSNIAILSVVTNIVWVSLLVCSITMLAIIIERFIYFQIIKRKDNEFVEKIAPFIASADYKSAIAFCDATESPLSRIIKAAFVAHTDGTDVNASIVSHSSREVSIIERFIPILSTISTVAPLFGLLGTIIGMIQAFAAIAVEGTGTSLALANGISSALLTTAAGLIIAIPSVLTYNYFVGVSNERVSVMEHFALEVANKLNGKN